MANKEIHLYDIGTAFRATVKDSDGVVVDVSSAVVMTMKFKKPNGTTVYKTATFVTNGTDGKIQYVSAANDLDMIGNWSIEAFVQFVNGQWHSDINYFQVHRNL